MVKTSYTTAHFHSYTINVEIRTPIMQASETDTFWQYDNQYWLGKLNSSANGLSQINANQAYLQAEHIVKMKSVFRKDFTLLVGQFKSPLMLLLIGAVILSAFVGDTSDVFIILFIVISTSLLSFFQERNAGRIVDKLQSIIALQCTVIRDGKETNIIASKVVAGDLIILKAGDLLPADCLIIEANELHANEASLTGESYPAAKEAGILDENTELTKRTNSLWQGTSIVSGTAKAIVINTGAHTIFSTITKNANATVETKFEKGIKDFGFFLMKITLVLSLFILIINLLYHKNVMESALFALALAVGMAPELLPAITTIAMSAGAKRMLAKKVIVKKLTSIQNLGEVNLLCTDKTGTITEGTIKVIATMDGLGSCSEFVKEIAFWNASFQTGYSNPMDDALKELVIDSKITAVKTGEIPYDFIRKRLSISIHTQNDNLLISKGAFSQIISICSSVRLNDGSIANLEVHSAAIEKNYEQYGIDGLRAIGICYKSTNGGSISKEDENTMIFAGFILLEDPIKTGIVEAIEK
ncbi:HAD-IC family P-type ATPase [Flavobacterium degerlachei]|nr:HAD-IC family P-type ATPase [Flavobacterium degerlachei]